MLGFTNNDSLKNSTGKKVLFIRKIARSPGASTLLSTKGLQTSKFSAVYILAKWEIIFTVLAKLNNKLSPN